MSTLSVRELMRAGLNSLTSRGPTTPAKPMSLSEYKSGREPNSSMPTLGRPQQQQQETLRQREEVREDRTNDYRTTVLMDNDYRRTWETEWSERSWKGGVGAEDGVTYDEAEWDGTQRDDEEYWETR